MKKAMKTSDVTRQVFDRAVESVQAMAANRHGFVAELVRELEIRTGARWHRQHVEMWLHPDHRKRKEPRFGAGQLLFQLARELNERHKYERNAAEAEGSGGDANRVRPGGADGAGAPKVPEPVRRGRQLKATGPKGRGV